MFYKSKVLYIFLLFLVVTGTYITGCTKEIAPEPEPENNNEKPLQLDELEEEIISVAEEAFFVYFNHVNMQIFEGEARTKLDEGNLNVNYPAIQNFSEKAEIKLTDVIKIQDEEKEIETYEVKASINYPKIDSEKFEHIEKEILNKITAKADNDKATCLRKVFTEVLEEYELYQNEITKSLTIKQIGDKFKVIDIDLPGEIFLSFHELYNKAVVENINNITVELDNDKTFNEIEDNVKVDFVGSTIIMENIAPGCQLIDPLYFANKTTIIVHGEVEIEVNELWEKLQEFKGFNPFMNKGPERFFHQISLGETSEINKKPIYLTRPYMAATMSSVVGLVDIDTNEINLFRYVTGGEISDFYWSLEYNYAAFNWSESGSGFSHLDVYSLDEDRIIEVTDRDKFIETYGSHNDKEQASFVGQFKNIEWSGNEEYLYFETAPLEGEKEETITWRLNIKEESIEITN